ncbi:MAG: M48 family metallopeptidase, partial [bacterium]|nr:M48 family metallopeptidase [bacterium]
MIQTQLWFFWLFVALYALHLGVEVTLDVLNLREMNRNQRKIPDLFQDSFSEADYQKSIAYTRSKTHFSWVKAGFDVVFLWFLILSGGFYFIDQWIGNFLPMPSLMHQVAYPLTIGALFYFLHLPFGIYHQFVLEEKYGFNRMTWGTFLLDQIKTGLIALVLGVPLLALIFSLVEWMGNYWWLGAWGVMMAFQLLTAAIFPVILAPIFYKFTPLEEGELKEKIYRLADKVRFKMAGVFTIDGSRRSSHSNAFFAGMGKTRRIVLFDTLVENLSTAEIIAVLAHEMGHNVKKHIQKGLLISTVTTLLGFFILSLCLKWEPFFATFGVPEPSLHVGLVLFGLLSSVFTFPFNPLFKWFSR